MIYLGVKRIIFIRYFVYFAVLVYVFSSWWSWDYGCSFGSRPMVEYLVIFAIPIVFFVKLIFQQKMWLRILASVVGVVCIIYNLKMSYSYDDCFYGTHHWDWDAYIKILLK